MMSFNARVLSYTARAGGVRWMNTSVTRMNLEQFKLPIEKGADLNEVMSHYFKEQAKAVKATGSVYYKGIGLIGALIYGLVGISYFDYYYQKSLAKEEEQRKQKHREQILVKVNEIRQKRGLEVLFELPFYTRDYFKEV